MLQAKATARDESSAVTEAKRQEAESYADVIFARRLSRVTPGRYVELIRPQAERKMALEDAANGLVVVKAVYAPWRPLAVPARFCAN